MSASAEPTSYASIESTLDESLEAARVAIGLGMTVPAIEGTTLWMGQLHQKGHNPYVFTAPPCTTRETVETYLVNFALKELADLSDEMDCPWRDRYWKPETLETEMDELETLAQEYTNGASNLKILRDYEKYCSGTFVIWKETVIAVDEPRGTIEWLYERRLAVFPPEETTTR